MTHAGIECFLAVCRHKTGSHAAEALYITQSSLSTRLKTLERELGGALFYRKKGGREMHLTPAGKEFYELAVQYERLMAQMQQVCHRQPGMLRVSALNSLSTYLLPEVYDQFLQRYPHTSLQIQDMELESACRSLRSGETDLAFTAGKIADSDLRQTVLMEEPMVLVAGDRSDYPDRVQLSCLSPREQVYISWSSRFDRWYQKRFGGEQPQITVSIMAQLQQFMSRPQCWAIVPITVARGLEKSCGVRTLTCDEELPHREISCLTDRATDNAAASAAFLDSFRTVLRDDPNLRIL